MKLPHLFHRWVYAGERRPIPSWDQNANPRYQTEVLVQCVRCGEVKWKTMMPGMHQGPDEVNDPVGLIAHFAEWLRA